MRIVLAVLRGEVTIAEAARREAVSQTSIANWRDQFLDGGAQAVAAGGPANPVAVLVATRSYARCRAVSSGPMVACTSATETSGTTSRTADYGCSTLLARSSLTKMPFQYKYNPGRYTYEEPDGVTWWDLDDGRAPEIRGQLHAMLLDNETSNDDVYIKHYRAV